jgi:hypothetical protein
MTMREFVRLIAWLPLGVLPAALFWALLDPRRGLDTGLPALALAAMCACKRGGIPPHGGVRAFSGSVPR